MINLVDLNDKISIDYTKTILLILVS